MSVYDVLLDICSIPPDTSPPPKTTIWPLGSGDLRLVIVFGIGAKMLKSRGQTGFETKKFGLVWPRSQSRSHDQSFGLKARVTLSRLEFRSQGQSFCLDFYLVAKNFGLGRLRCQTFVSALVLGFDLDLNLGVENLFSFSKIWSRLHHRIMVRFIRIMIR